MRQGASDEAAALVVAAEKALKKFTFFDKTSKVEDAAEKYAGAGKLYGLAGNHEEAGKAFLRAAELHGQLGDDAAAGTAYQSAGDALVQVDINAGIVSLQSAVQLHVRCSRGVTAANTVRQIAELYQENAAADEAIANYEEAALLFDAEKRAQTANQCREKIAFIAVEQGDHRRGALEFEALGKAGLSSSLTKYNARSSFLKSLLCVLASGDVVNAELKLSEFAALDYTFQGTLEGNLAEAVCAACAATDAAAFATACAEYDKIKRLDPWHTGLLLAIKKMHGEEDGGEDEDLT